jgi:hypothetical protein
VDDLLIGREPERQALASLAAAAVTGNGSIVLVAGEAGVGKTTLARRSRRSWRCCCPSSARLPRRRIGRRCSRPSSLLALDASRRPHRARQLDPDGRARPDVQDDGPFQPAPPPSSRFDWGDEKRVRELLGESFDLRFEERTSTLRLPSGEAYWELFSTSYGPTRTLAESLGDRREELHSAWVDFFESNYRSNGEIAHRREYLLVVGERR